MDSNHRYRMRNHPFRTPFGPAIRLPLIQALVSTSASTAPNTAESLLRRLNSHFQSPEKARESAYLRPAAGPGLLGMAEFRHRPARTRALRRKYRSAEKLHAYLVSSRRTKTGRRSRSGKARSDNERVVRSIFSREMRPQEALDLITPITGFGDCCASTGD